VQLPPLVRVPSATRTKTLETEKQEVELTVPPLAFCVDIWL